MEKAIAHYEAKNDRPNVQVYTGNLTQEGNTNGGIFDGDNLYQFIGKALAPERYGYEYVDAIAYYTQKLQELNEEVIQLQKKNYEMIEKADEKLLAKMKNRHDTRAAAVLESIHHVASKMEPIARPAAAVDDKKKDGFFSKMKTMSFDQVLLGTNKSSKVLDIDNALHQEMNKIERETSTLSAVKARRESMVLTPIKEDPSEEEDVEDVPMDSDQHVSMPKPISISKPTRRSSLLPIVEESSGMSLTDDPVFKEMMENAGVDFQKEEEDAVRRRAEYEQDVLQRQQELLRKGTEAELKAYVESAAGTNPNSIIHRKPINPFAPKQDEEEGGNISDNEVEGSVSAYDEADIRSGPAKRPSRVNDFIDNLGDMRKTNAPVHDMELSGGSVHGRRASILESIGKFTPFATASTDKSDELSSSQHGRRSTIVPTKEEPSTIPTSSSSSSSSSSAVPFSEPPPPAKAPTTMSALFNTNKGYESLHDEDDLEKAVTLEDTRQSRARRGSRDSVGSSMPSEAGVSRKNFIFNPILNSGAILTDEQKLAMNMQLQKAKSVSKEGWNQTQIAIGGASKAAIEIERTMEMLLMGAYYKYSSTAFVTFKSRVTESIAYQMLLSHDTMEISHAPNPHDIIWDNVAIPKSQITLRHYITNCAVIVGSIFWSSLVNSVNVFASFFPFARSMQQMTSAVVMLVFLLILPFIFDALARYYEGMKLESEIQNSIMTRYFYYQLINVYVTVGFSGSNLWFQIIETLQKPQSLVDIIGGRVPDVSLFFTNLIIVKVFTAIPLEMIRPWQLSTILLMGNCMDRRETTRRDLRTGAFYSWPMLYGWIYPQLMMVLMIMVTYSCITPLIMPFCVLFFAAAYLMYKYQLLYVYINDYQSGGFMWYAVFNRSLIALAFASIALVGKHFTLIPINCAE